MIKMFFVSLLVSVSFAQTASANTTVACQDVVNSKENIVAVFNGKTIEVTTVDKRGVPTGAKHVFSNLEFKRNGNYETAKGWELRSPAFPTYAEAMSVAARPYNEVFVSIGFGNLPSTIELLIRNFGTNSDRYKYSLNCP